MIRIALAALVALSTLPPAQAATLVSRPSLAQPAISPDGREIAFVSGGDIWTVPAAGGEARLLVSDPADERRPLYSPDGTRLAFVSDRSGNGDIYVLDMASGVLRRLTFDDGSESLDAWSPDGRWIYFSSTTADISGMNDIFRVAADGGTPMPVTSERYTNEFFAAPSPDGKSLLFNAHGIASGQWWRHGSSHIDQSEIWLLRDDASPGYRKIIDRGDRSIWPMWSADGTHFYFVSDRGGAENLWISDLAGTAKQLTSFRNGRVLWPAISRDGRSIVFERDFGIWRFDTSSGEAKEVTVALRGAPAAQEPAFQRLTGDFEEMALSPDGKKIALIVHGEVFAVSAADGGEAARVTHTPQAERHVAWAPDSKRLVYTSTREPGSNLYLYDFTSNTETKLTDGASVDTKPLFSPDGKTVAFLRDGRELRILDLASKADRLVATASIDLAPPLESPRPFIFSPDGKWLAFLANGDRMFRNAFAVSIADGSAPVQVSYLPNVSSDTISWSPDGKSLFFDSGQRTENGSLVRVDLAPRTPQFREEQFRKLFHDDKKDDKKENKSDAPSAKNPGKKGEATAKNEDKKDEKKPVEIVADGIRDRMTLLPTSVDVAAQAISPDGKEIVMIARAEGAENLYLYSLDELAKEPPVARQLTSTRESKSDVQFSSDGKTVYYLEDGSIVSIPIEKGSPKKISVSAPMEIDFESEKLVVFDQAWGWLKTHFHDPKMNGADWNGIRQRWAPQVAGAHTEDELVRILSLMVGELNSSHSGVRSGGRPERTTGRIGLRFDRAAYESADDKSNGAFRISGIVPLSPAAVTRKIAIGEYLIAIDGASLTRTTPIEKLLENRIGKEVRLTLAADAAGAKRHDVTVRPISQPAEKELIHREWVEKNRAYVAKLSGGRLGYVHIPDMSYGSFLRLMTDLDATNMTRDGVVIDIRNNNGGFINAYALDTFSRHPYLNMTFRGLPTATARTVLGQRSLEKPTILITNQHALSDAEDFTEGYHAMKLGKIVGEPTAGWIIYTSNATMIDGSTVRLPFITITNAKGEPMEMHPRPVDVEVKRALGEDAAGRDSQLERAVTELLAQIGK